jgi:hypothetical protein
MAELLAPSERGEERDVGQLLVVAVACLGGFSCARHHEC